MARTARQITTEDSRSFNEMRSRHLQEKYTHEEMQVLLRKYGFPGDWNFIKALTRGENSPLRELREVVNGKIHVFYTFSDKPTYIERIKSAYKEYRDKTAASVTVQLSRMTVKNAAKIEDIPQQTPQEEEKDSIQIAIELLKAEGYRIYKPKVEYEEL